MKINYETKTTFRFNCLSKELQEEAKKTYSIMEEKTAEVWENIVNYYYNIEMSPPLGWFNYWE